MIFSYSASQKRRNHGEVSSLGTHNPFTGMGRRPPHTTTGKISVLTSFMCVLFLFPLPPPIRSRSLSVIQMHTPFLRPYLLISLSLSLTPSVVSRVSRAVAAAGSERTSHHSRKTLRGTCVRVCVFDLFICLFVWLIVW